MATLALVGLAGAHGQVYLHWPPGSQNRLDQGSGPVSNPARLFDSGGGDPNAGGYGYGGSATNQAAALKFFAGSQLSVAFSVDQTCDRSTECSVVIQTLCNPSGATAEGVPGSATGAAEGPLRDGTVDTTPDPNSPNADTGLHEPASFYTDCAARERNKNLYTADQNVSNTQGALATRQNPNGVRFGHECGEERALWPYPHPSPWKDVAVLTNTLDRCTYLQAESQNGKAKSYCSDPQHNHQAACEADGDTWLEQAPFNLPAPDCLALRPAPPGALRVYNWSVPSGWGTSGADDVAGCALRVRLNITGGNAQACSNPTHLTQAACTAAGHLWSSLHLDGTYNTVVLGSGNVDPSTTDPPLLQTDPDTDMGGFLNDGGGTDSLLQLSVDTRFVGRTYEDRSHSFEIQARPASVSASTVVYNLNVLGKRGVEAEVRPARPLQFWPDRLVVGMNDVVSVQWTGNDQTFYSGAGLNGTERHNLVQIASESMNSPMPYSSSDQAKMFDVTWEFNPEGGGEFAGARNTANLVKQFGLAKQTGCATNPTDDQAADNCQVLNRAEATVDLGLLKFKPGEYHYLSTRNNRPGIQSHKGALTVLSTPSVVPEPPVHVTASLVGETSVELSWSPPGPEEPFVGFDGNEYYGMDQVNTPVAQYSVSYSLNGGTEWIAGPATCAFSPCTVEGLPRETTVLLRVAAWGQAGEGAPSEYAFAKTADAEEEGLAAGDVAAISLGVVLFVCLLALVACIAFVCATDFRPL